MNSCSDTGIVSANSSCWERETTTSGHKLQRQSLRWMKKMRGCVSYLSLFLSGHTLTVFNLMSHLATQGTGSGFIGFKFLSYNGEVGLMGGQTQHDQISWRTIKDYYFFKMCFINFRFLLSVCVQTNKMHCAFLCAYNILKVTISSTETVMRVWVMIWLSWKK